MKISLIEVVIVIVIILAVVFAFRVFRGDRNLVAQGKIDTSDVSEPAPATGKSRVTLAGVSLVVLGFFALYLGASLFEMVFKMYMWAIVLVGIGIVVLVFSRKGR